MKKQVSFQLIFRPEDSRIAPYRLLPIMVPPGIKTIEIQYFYERNEENIIDLGLFDPRGSAFLRGLGFRGWSGSARNHVIISEHWATPGYLAGPIYPGTWQLLLGLYKIGGLCPCEVNIFFSDDPVVEAPSSQPLLGSSSVVPGWLKGDLHCHTCHSDAESTVDEMWAIANKKGLDFLAITDHNTVSHLNAVKELNEEHKLLLLPGQEITTYKGHANALGLWEWVDFRCTKDEEIAKVSEFVRLRNGIFSINHPKTNGPNWEFSMDFEFDCIEVWHAFWQLRNAESLGVWDSLLQQRRKVIALGGSDAHPRRVGKGHLLEWLGCPTTWIYTKEVSLEGLVQAIKCGHVSISACPHGPFIAIELCGPLGNVKQGETTDQCEGKLYAYVDNGEGLRFQIVSSEGLVAQARVTSNPWKWMSEVSLAEQKYIRAELCIDLPGGKSELVAITNPIWYKPWLEGEGGKQCKKR